MIDFYAFGINKKRAKVWGQFHLFTWVFLLMLQTLYKGVMGFVLSIIDFLLKKNPTRCTFHMLVCGVLIFGSHINTSCILIIIIII